MNPIYKLSINIGIINPLHASIIPLSQSAQELRMSSVSVNSDQLDNERRRAIALRALNERWKSLNADSSKHQIPKSFPQSKQQHQHGHGHGHSHGPGFNHSHNQERKVIPKFNIDEIMKPIPLPPPPAPKDSSANTTTSNNESNINS